MTEITMDRLVEILEDRGREARHISAIAGPPGSGKSTVADRVAEALNAREEGSAAVFPMDGFHYDDAVLNARGWRPRKGAPHTFDVGGFASLLARLRDNREEEIAVPVFDRGLEISRNAARIIPRSVRHLIVEGNYLLLDAPHWRDLDFDTTVYLEVPIEEIERRLLSRWKDLTGDALTQKMEANDMPNARLVVEQRRASDFVLRNV
ncbi:MAG: nucleoside/nucleotide kinase family protein [Maritimibacter sp.]